MTNFPLLAPLTSHQVTEFTGKTKIPGDKSISHRSLILGALTVGETTVTDLLESEDVLATAQALRMFGAGIEKRNNDEWSVYGFGTGGFADPSNVIDCGNSGTSVRLLMGAIATSPISATFTGDASLRARPMKRVTIPLSEFGAEFIERPEGLLPITVIGTNDPVPIHHYLETKSAQVKSAILLAALNAPGKTIIFESAPTRDHTERMLQSFNADIVVENHQNGRQITLNGYAELTPQHINVPSDISSAAFIIAAALMVENSNILLPGININPTRNGFLTTVQEMGANLEISDSKTQGGETVADIRISHCPLSGVEISPERAPTMIDEYPILCALAAIAEGDTIMHGVGELRLKESDRIDAMARGLEQCGVSVTETKDSLTVHGCGFSGVKGGAICETHLDHRIAMSFLCLGICAQESISIDDSASINTSFPNFVSMMNKLGANIQPN